MPKWLGYHIKDGRAYYRRRIPADLKEHFGGRAFINQNLHMPAGKRAQILAGMMCLDHDLEWDTLRERMALAALPKRTLEEHTDAEIDALAAEWARDLESLGMAELDLAVRHVLDMR